MKSKNVEYKFDNEKTDIEEALGFKKGEGEKLYKEVAKLAIDHSNTTKVMECLMNSDRDPVEKMYQLFMFGRIVEDNRGGPSIKVMGPKDIPDELAQLLKEAVKRKLAEDEKDEN
jgi:hypothetical protein